MNRLFLGLVAIGLAGGAAQAEAATLPLAGEITALGTAGGLAVGDEVSGTVTFDAASPDCPAFCPVTDVDLRLPGGVVVGLADAVTTVSLADRPPTRTLDGWFDLPAGAYGAETGTLFVGAFALGGPGTFDILAGDLTSFVAGGDIDVVPLPGALPLAATGLGALAWLGRRRQRPAVR